MSINGDTHDAVVATRHSQHDHADEEDDDGDDSGLLEESFGVSDMINRISSHLRSFTHISLNTEDSAALINRIAEQTEIKRRRTLRVHKHEMQRRRVDTLSERAIRERKLLNEQRTIIQERRTILVQRLRALQALADAAHIRATTDDSARRAEDASMNTECQRALIHIEVRRRRLLYNLQYIYPIAIRDDASSKDRRSLTNSHDQNAHASAPPKLFTVRGLLLPPYALSSYVDEQISSALGYVVHMLIIIANLWNVSLRYRLIYRSSRSLVADDSIPNTFFPLFAKGVEAGKMECAVLLLCKDMEQIARVVTRRRALGDDSIAVDRSASQQTTFRANGQNTLEHLQLLIEILFAPA